ncbi:redoxin family protein [Telluria aromaticivorans]|uniref:TlpA family protein disulfide reductase n=1 Tax=Telluria aromaticivorans TaxID=2725995 RepID=A0A7Y2NY00_9BURK|nr:TlpA family protein disulfide reductase [Telluria aromaticivorans]
MDVVKLGPVVLPVATLLVLASILLANAVTDWYRRRRGLDAGPLLWKIIIAGFLAARAVFVLRHHDIFLANPLAVLDIRDGGFDRSVGIIVACAIAAELTRRHAHLRRPLLAATMAGAALWFGGTMLNAAFAPPQAPLPDLMVRRLDGSELALRSFQGKPLVVNLWATWCPPCRREMPALRAAQRANPDVAFVFVNQGESAAAVAQFMAAQGLAMANVVTDPAAQLAARTNSPGYPTTLFYDARGVLQSRHAGELSEASLREKLDAMGR